MLKPDDIRKSNWETDVLSPGHVEYAAVDACISLEIYQSFKDLCTADKATPAALGYLRDILPDESNLSKREQLITPKNKSSIGMETVKVANLLVASEPKCISSLVQASNPPVISRSNTEPISSTSNSSRALPSRVLKDAFHLPELIKVSLRHGLSKDFIHRFCDALFVIDSDDKPRKIHSPSSRAVSYGQDYL
ncbi:uncharacterized protein EV154DRAFT_571765 [Mucor mucedo]|uniref:uncharacterized protein n=1 Tax=Mucor mucedo TaxID=29922 RepID=UPI002220FADF|nr:uncharacterized protein EV154DRAFT_571765 [Mucor mucedo]KAI7867209.1 hypothetical protein EV154DRAFT_571765 [Mucor mucedo]